MGIEVYVALLIIFIILLEIFDRKCKFIPFIPLVLFSGFRYNVGRDYNNYIRIFEEINTSRLGSKIEFGYAKIVQLVYEINGTQQLVFLIMAFLTVYFSFKFIEEFTYDFKFSSLLFLLIGLFYLNSFNSVRQSLAISIMLYSTKYYLKGNFWSYFAYSLLAISVHKSSLLFFLIVPILSKDFRFRYKLIIAGALIYINKSSITLKILKMFNYTKVLNFTYYEMNLSQVIYLAAAIILVLLTNFKFRFSDDIILDFTLLSKDKKTNNLFKNLILFSGILIVLAFTSSVVPNIAIVRFNNYFMYSYLIVIPNIISQINDRKLKWFAKIIIILFSVLYYVNLLLNEGTLLPYNLNFRLFC